MVVVDVIRSLGCCVMRWCHLCGTLTQLTWISCL